MMVITMSDSSAMTMVSSCVVCGAAPVCAHFDPMPVVIDWHLRNPCPDNGEIDDHGRMSDFGDPPTDSDWDDTRTLDIVFAGWICDQIDRMQANVFVPVPHDWMPDIDGEHDPDDCAVCDEGRDCVDLAPTPHHCGCRLTCPGPSAHLQWDLDDLPF